MATQRREQERSLEPVHRPTALLERLLEVIERAFDVGRIEQLGASRSLAETPIESAGTVM